MYRGFSAKSCIITIRGREDSAMRLLPERRLKWRITILWQHFRLGENS